MKSVYIVKESPEIPLKSHRTRPRFESKLVKNIEDILTKAGYQDHKITISGGVIFVYAPKGADRHISKVFGVHNVCTAFEYHFSDLRDIAAKALEIYGDIVRGKKFAVRVKRSGNHDFTSLDVAREVGSKLKPLSSGVDLTNPDVKILIEVRGRKVYFITECVEGVGGLPIGVEGRVLSLFSGGFDSTVASWLAAKRGCEVDLLHYHMGSADATVKAIDIAKDLSQYFSGYSPKLIIIDLSEIIAEISEKIRSDYRQVVLRWAMHLIAQKLLRISGYDAVITGESIGQASSQTLKNIRIVEECLPSDLRRPIIRPLSTMDKEEIIKLSRKLGFYEKSSKLREVCVVASGPVTTRADIRVFKEELNKLNMKLIDKALDDRIIFNITEMSAEALTKILLGDIEIDYIPKDAILIDARPDTEYQKRHPPGSIHISQLKYVNLPKNKTLIVYCDEGSTSISWAKALRLIGFKAFSLKGGTRKLKELIEF